jgi:transposase
MKRRDCPGCRRLQKVVDLLQGRVRDLEARLGQNASNSSTPPSANPPSAARPVVKEPTGRTPGGQPGHTAYQRVRLPAERLQHIIQHVPKRCRACHHPLPAEPRPGDPEPHWHQVAELPDLTALVTEHQGHARACPGCGVVTRQPIPAEIRAHGFGPRLTAVMAYLSGARHDSKRGVEEIVETVFGVPIALGTVSHSEAEVSAALAGAHAEATQAVAAAAHKNTDETGWKRAGRLCWLWTAVSDDVALFRVHGQRGLAGLTALLGDDVRGILTTDRWCAYQRLDAYRRQLCWAHLVRDFQALVERGGPGQEFGEELLCLADDVFHDWYRVRDGTLARSSLRTYLDGQRPWLRDLLARGSVCGCAKAEALCRNLLAWEPSLWTFARVEGLEPTNNRAERALRPAVLWRRRSFGCHSERGCRFVERLLTVVQTLRLQGRTVVHFLQHAITAARQGFATPKLLPIG